MQRRTVLTLAVAFVLALVAVGSIQIFAAGAATSAGRAEAGAAASVDPVEGTDLRRITLSKLAARRIGLRTDVVRLTKAAGAAAPAKSVPYSALLYDDRGKTWVYTRLAPLVFVRSQVDVALVEGRHVILRNGPALGTKVATVGAAELYGAEFEITDE